ncbi:hypothetical protein B0H13DRAFT_1851991 [Mycena leptocephala]|nr:hypothetical protein B0H13DRAFT_1851991 [Mycena leptocephala]
MNMPKFILDNCELRHGILHVIDAQPGAVMATPRAKCAASRRSSRNLRIRLRLLPPPRAASLSPSGTPQTAALPVKRSVPPPPTLSNGHVETVPTTRSYNAHVPIVAMALAGRQCIGDGGGREEEDESHRDTKSNHAQTGRVVFAESVSDFVPCVGFASGPHRPTLASFPTLHPALHPCGRKRESGSKERVGSMAPTAPSFRISSLPTLHPALHPCGQKRESGSKERVGSMAPTAPSFRISSLPTLHPALHPCGQKRESGSKERVGSMAPTAPTTRTLGPKGDQR